VIAQALNVVLGLWLMIAPSALGYSGTRSAVLVWILGPLVFTFAAMALWGVLRALRWVNVALGLAVAAGGLALAMGATDAVNHLVCGILVTVLSLLRGTVRHPYAGGWRALLADAR
jgi:hypothetical protein